MDDCCAAYSLPKVKVLELFSGIGGVHAAFQESKIPHQILQAIDINTVVNEIYHLNFSKTFHSARNILSLTSQEIDKLKPDIITMSPPCQPFTRVGLKKGLKDSRSESFLHILYVITQLERKPSYFFLENVKGFESSDARSELINTLQNNGYTYQEFLLTPLQFGIPNSRLRYYLIAKLLPLQFPFVVSEEVIQEYPVSEVKLRKFAHTNCKESMCCSGDSCSTMPLSHFLEDATLSKLEKYRLPDKVLLKYFNVLDIVNRSDCKSCCFTKGYSHYVLGTGSVLQSDDEYKVAEIYDNVSKTCDKEQQLNLLRKLKLRYFTPKEVANLMNFPPEFCFPEHLSDKQLYRALGNSVNVYVISSLLQLLLNDRCLNEN